MSPIIEALTDAIRQRHIECSEDGPTLADALPAHKDRGDLLAIVHELTVELTEGRAGLAKTSGQSEVFRQNLIVAVAEVDRLTTKLAEAEDDHDAVCRSIGCHLRGGYSADGGAA